MGLHMGVWVGPMLFQAPKLAQKQQLECSVCRMTLQSSDEKLSIILSIVFAERCLPPTEYHWCTCGRWVDDVMAHDRNYRRRWRRHRCR